MKFIKQTRRTDPRRRLAADTDAPRSVLDVDSQWRRNRTLSGRHREPDAPSSRAKVHDLTQRRRKIGGIFALVLAVVVVLLVLITQFTARAIAGSSSSSLTTPIEPARYEAVINDYLALHPAERLRFVLNEKELSAYAAIVTPEVAYLRQSSVDHVVDTNFTVTFRKPVAGWLINGRQFYVDDQGVVFEKNYYETPTVQIVDESGISPEQGTAVASARLLSFVGRVVALSREGGVEVVKATLPSGTTRELDIELKSTPTRIKFSIDRGAGEQVEDMARALTYLSERGTVPSYVDVRVSGRAAYR